jgi:hypothetical protein
VHRLNASELVAKFVGYSVGMAALAVGGYLVGVVLVRRASGWEAKGITPWSP